MRCRGVNPLVRYGADSTIEDSGYNTAKGLLSDWKEYYGERIEDEMAMEEAEREALERKMNEESSLTRYNRIAERNNYDEDSMESDPEYWDYLNS